MRINPGFAGAQASREFPGWYMQPFGRAEPLSCRAFSPLLRALPIPSYLSCMLRSVLSFLALVLSLSLSSCTKDDEPMPAPVYLLDQRWLLTEMNGSPAPTSASTYLTLPSSGSDYSGRAYCNQYLGQYELIAGSPMLRFTTQGSTYATCGLQEQETQYLHLLRQTTRYVISNRTLRLYGAENAVPLLVFKVED